MKFQKGHAVSRESDLRTDVEQYSFAIETVFALSYYFCLYVIWFILFVTWLIKQMFINAANNNSRHMSANIRRSLTLNTLYGIDCVSIHVCVSMYVCILRVYAYILYIYYMSKGATSFVFSRTLEESAWIYDNKLVTIVIARRWRHSRNSRHCRQKIKEIRRVFTQGHNRGGRSSLCARACICVTTSW